MDRNREARRATNMAAPPNGLSSSRRRHRTSSLRDSPDEDGAMELQEPGRLRDRGMVKKERGERERDRDRERERERSSRSKRRESRMTVHHVTTGSNRDDGDDTSEESVNDEEEDADDAGNGGGLRMLPPPPANPSTTAAASAAMMNNHHNHNHNPYSLQLHHRKSFPSSGNKMFRPAAPPPPAWKAPDEMIGVSVPRKARSASTKRSHEWTSGGGGAVGGGGGTEQFNRQSSISPARLASSAASPAPVAPSSPSSSGVSVRKKMKTNGGGSKPRAPKSSSKSSSSNPEELEIEIAEVLYGLMTQSQAPSKKETNDSTMKIDSNKSSSETKSRVSSPISNPQNSTSLSTVAPKRKRPRQVSENPFSVRNSSASSIKTEIDHHQHHQSPKTDNSSPYLENSSPASTAVAENGVSSFGFTTRSSDPSPPLPPPAVVEDGKCGVGKEEVEKDAPVVGLKDGNSNIESLTTTAPTNLKTVIAETESQKQEKFEIDLMAPPSSQRTVQDADRVIDGSNHKQMQTQETSKTKEDDKMMIMTEEQKPKAGTTQEPGESSKQAVNEERKIELHIDFEKLTKDSPSMASTSSNKSLHQALKHQQLSTKSETQTAQPSSLPIPMSVPGWPPMGYVAPLQGVISMDGNTMPSTPVQPLFTQPRPKRCATHCYIARNIHYLQQLVKMNPFWQAASGPAAPMFSTKHANPNVIQSIELQSGNTTGKDTKPSQATTVPDSAHRKQPAVLQQAMPAVAPNNILHGPAFIFPFNQQQAAVAATASARPKLSSTTATGGTSGAAGSASVGSSTATTAAAAAPAYSYPNMGAKETQYLAILQNHPYTFPIPAVGAPPNYRGNHPHPQTMPLFNGSFYSSQMIHPSQVSQVQQRPQQAPPQAPSQQTHQNSSGSTSSSQKHLQSQQRQQGSGTAAANGGGGGSDNNNNYSVLPKSRSHQQSHHMNPPVQARHLENEAAGGGDSPSTADSRFSRNPMSNYGQSLNFAMMYPPAVTANNSNDKKPQQQTQQQQQGLKSNSNDKSFAMMYPQAAGMSFASMNGTSMAQNHAIFQGLPESVRQSYNHMMMTPPAMVAPASASASASVSGHHSEQKKDFRMSEEPSRTTGHDSSNGEEDRKGSAGLPVAKSGQSIAFSRPDVATDASPSAGGVNLGSNNRPTRSLMCNPLPPGVQSSQHLQAQIQQQQQVLNQLMQQQQLQQNHNHNQNLNARSKNLQPSSNGSPYQDHLKTSSSLMGNKFSSSHSSFQLQTSNTNSSPVQVQSPYWKHTVRGSTSSQVSSSLASTTTSSLKNPHQPHQQQSSRSHSQSHTQISFGAAAVNQKTQSTSSQPPSNSGGNNQSPSPPMLVGSPTTSLSSSQPPKNTLVGTQTQRSSSSILGNPPSSNSTKSQHQQHLQSQQPNKPTVQQQQQQAMDRARAQMMYMHPYMQGHQPQSPVQAQQHSARSLMATPMPPGGYYHLPRKQQQQQQMSHQQSSSSSSSSTAMLSLHPPVTLANTTTSDPAEAIAAATSNLKGGVGLALQQGVLHASQYGGGGGGTQSSVPAGFPAYVHNASTAAAVQAKPAEQKQPAA